MWVEADEGSEVKTETTVEVLGSEPDVTTETEGETTIELDIPDLAADDEGEAEETTAASEDAEVTDDGIISE